MPTASAITPTPPTANMSSTTVKHAFRPLRLMSTLARGAAGRPVSARLLSGRATQRLWPRRALPFPSQRPGSRSAR